MKRVINVRPPLFCAAGIALGIYSGYEFYFGNYLTLTMSLVVIFLLTVLSFALKSRIRTKISLAAAAAFVLLGFFLLQSVVSGVLVREETGREVTVSGRVTDIGKNGNVKNTVYLENCADADGEKFGGRIKISVYDGEAFECGNVVTVKGNLYSVYPLKENVDTSYSRLGARYELTCAQIISVEKGKMRTDEKIRAYVYSVTREFMPKNSAVAYALLTGDRNAIDAETAENFERAGVVHLLAVSGLHVGFVVSVLCFFLKRLKLPPLAELAIIFPPLLFYAYVCGFSPSVVRALTMLVCSYLTKALRSRYDVLSSLCISVTVILVVRPLYLFDVGFQLSALSVYGIATLGASVGRAFSRKKRSKAARYLFNAFAASVSCTLATFCVVAYNFSYASVIGIFANLFVVPLVSLAFVFSAFGLIPSVFHYLLPFADILLQGADVTAGFFASLKVAVVSVSVLGVSSLIAAVWLFGAGGYVRLSKKPKKVFHTVCACALCIASVFAVLPESSRESAFVSVGYSSAVVAAADGKGNAVVVGGFDDGYAVSQVCERLKRRKIRDCVVFITDFSACGKENVQKVAEDLPVSKAYVLDRSGNDETLRYLTDRNVEVIYAVENYAVGESVSVRSFFDGSMRGAVVDFYGIKIAVLCGKNADAGILLEKYSSIDFIAAPAVSSANGVTTFTKYQTACSNNYGANKYGNFTIEKNNDRIYLKFRRRQ